jgi:tRNA-2-methylthio-N6-dimethylallyladenosine synthase
MRRERIVEGIPCQKGFKCICLCNHYVWLQQFLHLLHRSLCQRTGKEQASRDILDEIRELAANGCKEVTLLGQNVNSYGKDLGNGYLFPDLLRDVNKIENIERIRFVTSHPKDLSDDLIEAMAECEKVCEHIHLPLQAGSNEILRKMNRRYTREDYLKLVDRSEGNASRI